MKMTQMELNDQGRVKKKTRGELKEVVKKSRKSG